MFEKTLTHSRCILTEGSMFERLRRDPRIVLHPTLAHAALVFDQTGFEVLRDVHREYLEIGKNSHLPMITFTDTWRANRERVEDSEFTQRDVNGACAKFLCKLRDEFRSDGASVLVGAIIGCRGDAYRADEALQPDEALVFHDYQVQALADTDVDFLFAATLPAVSEALGISRAMAKTSLPYVISFVVRPDGTALDGTPLSEAIRRIDSEVPRAPTAFYVNCVHPSVLVSAYEALSQDRNLLRERVVGFQGNTSAKSPEELDSLADLDTETPERFASLMFDARERCGLKIPGGCCGTGTDHIKQLAELLAQAT